MRTASRIVALTTLLVLAGAAGQSPSAWAQVYPKDGAGSKRELKIFELKHASASAVLNHWRNLNYSEEFNGNASLAVDERTNSILIRAPQDQIEEVLRFLQVLDRAEAERVQTGNLPGDRNAVPGRQMSKGRDWQRQYPWPAENQSPEFQQYEQQARAAAQAYREQLAATPKDEKRMGELKAELQGAVHSAFHARQTSQRSQLAEMRKRLDEIEKNIASRSQRGDEIIQRRMEELLHPEQTWEGSASPPSALNSTSAREIVDLLQEERSMLDAGFSPDHSKTRAIRSRIDGVLQKVRSDNGNLDSTNRVNPSLKSAELSGILHRALVALVLEEQSLSAEYGPKHPKVVSVGKQITFLRDWLQSSSPVGEDSAGGTSQSNAGITDEREFNPTSWMHDLPKALAQAKSSRFPVFAYLQIKSSAPCRRMEKDVLASPEIHRLLSESFVTVVIDVGDEANRQTNGDLFREYRLHAVPTCIVFSSAGKVLSRTEGVTKAADFALMLKNAAAKSALDLTRDEAATNQAQTPAPTNSTTNETGTGFDPRKELLVAENAVLTAKAAIEEAKVDLEAAEASLVRLEDANARQKGTVPEIEIRVAQVEGKRKAAILNRARAELTGKERLLDLAKEQLASQIKLAEFELEHAKAQLELAIKEESRTMRLIESKVVSQAEYDKVLAETRAARANYDRAQARLEILHKALPGAKPADRDTSPKIPTTTNPGTPGKAQD